MWFLWKFSDSPGTVLFPCIPMGCVVLWNLASSVVYLIKHLVTFVLSYSLYITGKGSNSSGSKDINTSRDYESRGILNSVLILR